MIQERHALLPEATHDENARQDFVSTLRKMFTTELFPGTRRVYQEDLLPRHVAKHGKPPADQREVSKLMERSFYYRGSNVIGRAAQELLWDTVGESIERVAVIDASPAGVGVMGLISAAVGASVAGDGDSTV